MKQLRNGHGSISYLEKTLIFDNNDDTVELWDLANRKSLNTFKVNHDDLDAGFGMFIVDSKFCKNV